MSKHFAIKEYVNKMVARLKNNLDGEIITGYITSCESDSAELVIYKKMHEELKKGYRQITSFNDLGIECERILDYYKSKVGKQ